MKGRPLIPKPPELGERRLWGACLDSYLSRSEFPRKVGERAESLRKLTKEKQFALALVFLKCSSTASPHLSASSRGQKEQGAEESHMGRARYGGWGGGGET